MKKAKRAICIYKRANDGRPMIMSYSIINSKGERVQLIAYEVKPEPYHYRCFDHLYVECIRLANSNGYKLPFYEEFGALWYSIDFITLDEFNYHYGDICNYSITMSQLQHFMLIL